MRPFLWKLARWFLFRLDAETAHRLTIAIIRIGIRVGNVPLRIVAGSASSSESITVFGIEFQSRLGLAAGFDKNAEILEGLPSLGFGFAEIGTVTLRPQQGNDRPRLFRDFEQRSIFNHMGFNGVGASVVARRLSEARKRLPPGFRVGVNLGKNKDTPLEGAVKDYVETAAFFKGLADFIVVNVSSPNTPGLRSLQSPQVLRPLLWEISNLISGWSVRTPLLVKLSPEIEGRDLSDLIGLTEEWGVGGFVLTNTLAGTWQKFGARISGGWSGKVLTSRARNSLIAARKVTRLPIISVGGIMDVEEAKARIHLGADLIQIYSGWVYEGPGLPRAVSAALAQTQRP